MLFNWKMDMDLTFPGMMSPLASASSIMLFPILETAKTTCPHKYAGLFYFIFSLHSCLFPLLFILKIPGTFPVYIWCLHIKMNIGMH